MWKNRPDALLLAPDASFETIPNFDIPLIYRYVIQCDLETPPIDHRPLSLLKTIVADLTLHRETGGSATQVY